MGFFCTSIKIMCLLHIWYCVTVPLLMTQGRKIKLSFGFGYVLVILILAVGFVCVFVKCGFFSTLAICP